MRILFVEDDRDTRETAAELMRSMGHEVHDVGNAEEALRLLRGTIPFDALVADIGLPRMQGDVLAAEARSLRPRIRIVFTTGRNELHAAALDPGPIFLLKPYTVEELKEALGSEADRA